MWNPSGGGGYPPNYAGSALPPSATQNYDNSLPSDYHNNNPGSSSIIPPAFSHTYSPNSLTNSFANYGNVGFDSNNNSFGGNYGVGFDSTVQSSYNGYGVAPYTQPTTATYGTGTASTASNWNQGYGAGSAASSQYGTGSTAPYGSTNSYGSNAASGYGNQAPYGVQDSYAPPVSGYNNPPVASTTPSSTAGLSFPSVPSTSVNTTTNKPNVAPVPAATGNNYSSSGYNYPSTTTNLPPSGTVSPPYSPPPVVKPPTGSTGNPPVSVGQNYPPTSATPQTKVNPVGQTYPPTTTAGSSVGQAYTPTPTNVGQNTPTPSSNVGQTYPPTTSTGSSYGQTYPPTKPTASDASHPTSSAPPPSGYSFYGNATPTPSTSTPSGGQSYPPSSSASSQPQSQPPKSNVGQTYPPTSNVGQNPPASNPSPNVGQTYPPASSSVGQTYPPASGSSSVGQTYPPKSNVGQTYPPASNPSPNVGPTYPPASSSSTKPSEEEIRKKAEEATRLELEKHKAQHENEKKQKDEEINRLKEEKKKWELQNQIAMQEEKMKQEREQIRLEEEAIKREKLRVEQEAKKIEMEDQANEKIRKEMEKMQLQLQTAQLQLEENKKNSEKQKLTLEEERKKREEYEQQIMQQKMAASSSLTASLPPPIMLEGSVAVSSPMMAQPTTPRPNPAMEIDPKDIVMGSLIGKGAFGEVFRGKLFGKEVAVKKLIVDGTLDAKALEDFRGEIAVMSGLRHPNILLLMGACTQNPNNLMIVTEIAYSSIDRLLKDTVNPPSFKQRLIWARDTALGVNWLHCMKPPFLHLDLKAGNLLVDDNRTVKVSDFGMSQIKHAGGGGGTPLWMSPEMLLEKPFTEKTDIYSYAVTLWEIFTGGIPFDNSFESYDELVDAVCLENERPKIPPTFPTKLKNLITACWDVNPEKRPSLTSILNDDIFAKILVDYYIPEGSAANAFWVSHFLDRDQVPWTEFRDKLVSNFKLPSQDLESKSARLKILMTDNKHHNQSVTIESFATVVAVLDLDDQIMTKASLLAGSPFFHGDLRDDEVERFLGTMGPGTWLIRSNSSLPQLYFISVKDKSFNKVVHYPITAKCGKFSFKGSSFDSLEAIIMKYTKELGLDSVCQGSKYSLSSYK